MPVMLSQGIDYNLIKKNYTAISFLRQVIKGTSFAFFLLGDMVIGDKR